MVVYSAVMEPMSLADDLTLLIAATNESLSRKILDDVRATTGVKVRHGDGYVFQHLLVEPMRVSELARRLGVTQQAASKQVADLERRGLVLRTPDPSDGRAALIEISALGSAAVDSSRTSRKTINQQVDALLGPEAASDLRSVLTRLAEHLGAADLVASRALRPESTR